MEQIQTLSTLRGREIVRKIFRELRFDKQLSSFSTISMCWRICARERDIFRFSKQEIVVLHPLGILGGTSIWLQEIINRFYFQTINSLVYFGAAILLVIIGIYRFSSTMNENFVIGGIIFEALLLMLMFVIMFFTPVEDDESQNNEVEEESETQQLIREIGEIGSDYAGVATRMDEVTSTLSGLLARQDEIIIAVNEVAKLAAQAVSPQPELSQNLVQTNLALQSFTKTVGELAEAAKAIRREEIQHAVRKEIENLMERKPEGR